MRAPLWGLLVAAVCLQPARAQDLTFIELQQAGAGGHASGGTYSLFSSVGTAAPSGRAENQNISVAGGGRFLVEPPVPSFQFTHVPVAEVDEGRPFVVSASVQRSSALASATLYYRRGSARAFSSVAMTEAAPAEWQAAIPAGEVTSEGVVYYVETTRTSGGTLRYPPLGEYGVAVRVEAPGLAGSVSLPGGSDQSAYRLVSVPLKLDDPAPASVFADDFGTYDPDQWRFYELLFDQDVREHPNTRPVEPGRSFWIITRNLQPAFDTGPGTSANPAGSYPIPVHPRWNLVANPFDFPVPTSNVSLQSGSTAELRGFGGSWNDPINDRVMELQPFRGYAVFNPSPSVDTLYVDPDGTRPASTAAKTMAGKGARALDWSVRIEARSGGAVDADNIAGVSRDAAEGLDAMDYPEPPMVGTFVSAYFVRPEGEDLTTAYSTDIRSTDLPDGEWDLHLRSSTGEPVHLTFEGVNSVPDEYDVVLVDGVSGVTADLRERAGYVVADPGARGTTALRILIGPSARISDLTADLPGVPQAVELAQVFPNPVRGSMTVRYGIPESGRVVLRLYDGLGRLVHELANRAETAGVHTLVWQASGDGLRLANGVYLLELRSGGVRRVRTLTIID